MTNTAARGLRFTFASPRQRKRSKRRPLSAQISRVRVVKALAPDEGKPFPPLRSTPRSQPLAMPRQDLRSAPQAKELAAPSVMAFRRLAIFACAMVIGVASGVVLFQVLGRDGLTWAEGAAIALSACLSAWIGFGFASAMAGFLSLLFRRSVGGPVAAAAEGGERAALLLPTYNEDPGLVFSAAEAIAHELHRVGLGARCDVFILSDTRDDEIASAEAAGLVRLRSRLMVPVQIHYRRRPENLDRKAGNIGDWVRTQGGAYGYMVVLDADSLIAGETIAALIAAMDQEPGLGLLQTVPTIVNAQTPFARLQQFASRLYGPVYATGQAWWSGSEGNYWGHNAIIRVRAFAESAGLPHLPGKKPFGGHILSHDFIEAALLRRRGWAVRTDAGLAGSYEETPPTLLDAAARDRRWCQGNLQHARLVGAAGLHWVSRVHLLCGIFAYLAPVFWLALLIVGATVWPGQHILEGEGQRRVVDLFGFDLALLVAPKLMALIVALKDAPVRRGFGGAPMLVLGVAAESLLSILSTPVMMLMQAVAVFDVVIGRDSGWSAQRREGVELSRRDAWRAHGGHVLLGVLGAAGAFLVSKAFLMWASPVFLSLALSALLSLHTSRPNRGGADGQSGLFQTPEDVRPPPVLVRSRSLRRAYADEAPIRRRIEQLFRGAVPAYDMAAARNWRAAPAARTEVSARRQPEMA